MQLPAVKIQPIILSMYHRIAQCEINLSVPPWYVKFSYHLWPYI